MSYFAKPSDTGDSSAFFEFFFLLFPFRIASLSSSEKLLPLSSIISSHLSSSSISLSFLVAVFFLGLDDDVLFLDFVMTSSSLSFSEEELLSFRDFVDFFWGPFLDLDCLDA